MSNVTDFVNQNLDLANSVSATTGVPSADILGQWGLETGWGSHFAGANNYGNVSPGGVVADYTTPQAGASAYASVIQSENVNPSSPASFAASVANAGYATDPNYTTKLTGAIIIASASMPQSPNASTAIANPVSAWDTLSTLPNYINLGNSATDPMATTMQGLYNQVTGTSPGQSAGAKAVTGSIGDWISAHIGGYGLVFFGAILIVGALIISQKDTVIKVAKGVAE